MADSGLDANLTTRNRQPIIATHATAAAGTAAALRVNIANIHTLGPSTGLIHHERIEFFFFNSVFERSLFIAFDLAHFQRVGLPHNNKHLNRLAHVGRFTVRVR